jgi:hypothetical protein
MNRFFEISSPFDICRVFAAVNMKGSTVSQPVSEKGQGTSSKTHCVTSLMLVLFVFIVILEGTEIAAENSVLYFLRLILKTIFQIRFQHKPSVCYSVTLLAYCFMLVFYLIYPSTPMMGTICSSKTSVGFQRTTRRYVSKDRNPHNHRYQNFISYVVDTCDSQGCEFLNNLSLDCNEERHEIYSCKQ